MPNLNNGDGNYGECPDENFSKNKHGLYRWNRRITPPSLHEHPAEEDRSPLPERIAISLYKLEVVSKLRHNLFL